MGIGRAGWKSGDLDEPATNIFFQHIIFVGCCRVAATEAGRLESAKTNWIVRIYIALACEPWMTAAHVFR